MNNELICAQRLVIEAAAVVETRDYSRLLKTDAGMELLRQCFPDSCIVESGAVHEVPLFVHTNRAQIRGFLTGYLARDRAPIFLVHQSA